MSVAGLERMTTGSVVKRLTLLRHKSGQINFTLHKAGAYAGFLRGGGPTLKFLVFWRYMPRSGEQRSGEPLLGGFGGMLPQENF